MGNVVVDAEMKEALRRYRATSPEHSHLEAELDAVVLVSDMGGDALLTMDGRLLQDSPFDGLGEIGSVILRRAVLFLGSQRVPELARLLPARTSDASECEQCRGGGWFQVKPDFRIPCGQCGGMGWVDDEVRAELANRALNPTGLRPAG
jgi:hypothetical protein